MSSEFFKALESYSHINILYESRLKYNNNGVIISANTVDCATEDSEEYIIITRDQCDIINNAPSMYRVVNGEVIYSPPAVRLWYQSQSELSSNPYIKD